jgi:hypothetical protein
MVEDCLRHDKRVALGMRACRADLSRRSAKREGGSLGEGTDKHRSVRYTVSVLGRF